MPTRRDPAIPALAPDEVVARFLAGTLPRECWTHTAHLVVCRHLLAAHPPSEALDRLRVLIPAHNARVGLLPSHGGYHETVTQYFVGAVAHLGDATYEEVVADPRCHRDAPLHHWSPELLGSDLARAHSVDPDLVPLPWAPLAVRP